MADQFDYKNSLNQNSSNSSKVDSLIPEHSIKQIDKLRDEMKEKYGWQSPYEYYYGSHGKDGSDLGSDSPTILSVREIEEFGKEEKDGSEQPDRDKVPHYFWLNSLSNWCYFKPTSFTPSFKHTHSWAPGPIRWILSALTLGLTEAIETISLNGWGSWWKAIIDIALNPLTVTAYPWLQVGAWIAGAGDLAKNYGTISFPFLVYSMITGAYLCTEADVTAETFVEEGTDNPGEILMPRACLSLYMWNGFKRQWISVKALIDTYNRYCKNFSRGMVSLFLEERFLTKLNDVNKESIIDGFIKSMGLVQNNCDTFKRTAMTYHSGMSEVDKKKLVEDLVTIICSDPIVGSPNGERIQSPYLRYMSRELVMCTYGFDPIAFDFLTNRGNISKKQVIGVDHGDSHGWAKWHYIEQWGMYAPLTRDSAKVKQFADKSFQLINRAYTYVEHDWRDHNGWIHKSLGHPCFFRGNDDCLWIAYWLRWTTGNLGEKKERSLFTETTTMDGAYDISKDDIENWESIIDLMFEKHDDYGFEEWMANCDYGVAYKKFTIDEESPTKVSTYEEATLNPNKVMPMNDIDRFNTTKIKLRLSSGTVVGRDDTNGMMDVAKRWR